MTWSNRFIILFHFVPVIVVKLVFHNTTEVYFHVLDSTKHVPMWVPLMVIVWNILLWSVSFLLLQLNECIFNLDKVLILQEGASKFRLLFAD